MNIKHENKSAPKLDTLLEQNIVNLVIPPCPTILSLFMTEVKKDEPDYNYLASVLGADISISAGLIKTANSSYFGLSQRVRSGGAALMMLGLKTTSATVAGIILRNSFPNVPNLESFWDTTMRISLLSGWLAVHLGIRGLRAEDAYTFGLFRDCGIPVLLGRSQEYKKILETANQEADRCYTEVENTEIQVNHATVGSLLAKSWYLPMEIFLAIGSHHDISALNSDESKLPLLSRRLIATSQLAEQILHHQLGQCLNQEWHKLGEGCMKFLELDEFQLEALYSEAESIVTTLE